MTVPNENEQITQLRNVNYTSKIIETYPHSLVVFINGARPRSTGPSTAPLSWTVTFAPTSRHNLSGTLDSHLPRTVMCAKQEAILRFLEFVKSESFDHRWRKVIVVVSNSIPMARLVEFLETYASNYNYHPATNYTTEQGRTEVISQELKEIWMVKNGLNIEFWLVPKKQIVAPVAAASNELGSSESSGHWQ
ncbi:hypothetical protein MRS44_015686 [Fusarium solani]|uniref:uncharacterized protein n=1 Tax=Fusarium solani TaxID=169388 RepID=UPI0032C48A74|nr:hypothetical protein MRS44_015686 [Fusarium solani]